MFTRRAEVIKVGRQVGLDRRAQRVELEVGGRPGRRSGHRRQSSERPGCYPAVTVRVVEIRMLEGPNVYRLEPVVKLELAIGRRRTWYGQRDPGRHALVQLGAAVPARDWPDPVAAIVAWIRRLRIDHDEGRGGLAVHRSSDPGHWIITFPWTGEERARILTEAAFALAERDVSPSRTAQLTGAQQRVFARWSERIGSARTTPPPWIRDADRRMPAVSISGTNGKSTVSRLITHILVLAGRHVGTTTSDGVLIDERLVEAGDWTGPGGAQKVLRRSDIDTAVLETARGGIVLRGMGYESNDASVLTNVSSDHLDLQGIHTLPELAEVKSTINRVTKRSGWVVLNGDEPLVASIGRRVRGKVAYFSLADGALPPLVRRHLARGGRAYVVRDGWLTEARGRPRIAHRRDRRACRSRSAGSRVTTSRMRWPPPVGHAGSVPRSPRSATASLISRRPQSARPDG